MLKLSNTDSQPFISTMMRIDKGLESAGDKGNVTTKALEQYGISLKDTQGNLLPMNEQLERLAEGYKKASERSAVEAVLTFRRSPKLLKAVTSSIEPVGFWPTSVRAERMRLFPQYRSTGAS